MSTQVERAEQNIENKEEEEENIPEDAKDLATYVCTLFLERQG